MEGAIFNLLKAYSLGSREVYSRRKDINSMAKRRTVVGVSWRRLQATPSPSRGNFSVPSGRILRSRTQNLSTANSVITDVQTKVMGRMTSFRGTLDTLRKVTLIYHCCARFVNLHNLQNAVQFRKGWCYRPCARTVNKCSKCAADRAHAH